jgi:hypothetical protein
MDNTETDKKIDVENNKDHVTSINTEMVNDTNDTAVENDQEVVEKSTVEVPQINVDVNIEGNLVANISQSGKTFQKCDPIVKSIISLEIDEETGGIKSITFTPPSICVKNISTDPTAASGGYRKVKRSTRKNKKRRSKRKY